MKFFKRKKQNEDNKVNEILTNITMELDRRVSDKKKILQELDEISKKIDTYIENLEEYKENI